MEIVEGKGIRLTVDNPELVTQAISKSRVLEDGSVLVYWGIKESTVLREMGLWDVPSPIVREYVYPGKDKPMTHQQRMAEFMSAHKRCFNFSDMGTGKTRAAVWAADYLMDKGVVRKALIVSPLSVLKTAWEADIAATAVHRSCAVAVGSPSRRQKLISSDVDFVIINHDGVKSSKKELKAEKFDLIIVDEATAFSNVQTDRWKALNGLLTPNTRLWLLTGTPAANSPLQAYGLARLVSPHRVPKFFSGWRELTMYKVTQFKWVPKSNARQLVYDALQPAIRFDKKDCLDLPPVTYVERECPMSATQAAYYQIMKNEMLLEAADQEITAVNSGVLMGKLLQLAAGAVYADNGSIIDFRADNRMKEMLDVINDNEHKVLVFAQYRHNIMLISNHLKKNGIVCETIDGDTPGHERTRIIDAFQQGDDIKVLVLQPRVAAHGITLTRANVAIWFSPTSNLEHWKQANDRVNRMGQQNAMTVVKLIGAPIERKVYRVLEGRDSDQSALLDLYREELQLTQSY